MITRFGLPGPIPTPMVSGGTPQFSISQANAPARDNTRFDRSETHFPPNIQPLRQTPIQAVLHQDLRLMQRQSGLKAGLIQDVNVSYQRQTLNLLETLHVTFYPAARPQL